MTPDQLADRARGLAASAGGRVVIGLTGSPGAGKSTLAEAIVGLLGPRAALVPMDGFHLSQEILTALGRLERKGAPDTFDADGLVSLLSRIVEHPERITYGPVFHRTIEEPIAAGVSVTPNHDIIIVEGNYLLVDHDGWRGVSRWLDEAWFLRIPPALRHDRLVQRHVRFGRTHDDAELWVRDVDERNARLIDATSAAAHLIIHGG
ncbi:nucleoside/nucleotide kinase family protein [Leifsonia aquatica]|uniref:nucleoside/nucleotide kinase family protein n=1 Tax=Leifsonia aquatica TaxID=144185 RepID=UPI000468FA32|nr:nucleoside/nucleotide kinase family protein [Leifsonia aquatica]